MFKKNESSTLQKYSHLSHLKSYILRSDLQGFGKCHCHFRAKICAAVQQSGQEDNCNHFDKEETKWPVFVHTPPGGYHRCDKIPRFPALLSVGFTAVQCIAVIK